MRDERILLGLSFCLAMIFSFSGCQKDITNSNLSSSSEPIPTSQVATSIPSVEPAQIDQSYSSIRKVDFKNFTYFYPSDSSDSFTLKDGTLEKTEDIDGAIFGKLEYGDVTNDENEEALINIQPITGGNCQCEMIFIYTLENKKPKLLWSFDTWDRAEGGFKRIYSENGDLAVEIFGDNRFENGEWKFNFPKDKFNGYCCPTAYTKIVFKWNGEKFVRAGKRQIFDYDWKKNQGK